MDNNIAYAYTIEDKTTKETITVETWEEASFIIRERTVKFGHVVTVSYGVTEIRITGNGVHVGELPICE